MPPFDPPALGSGADAAALPVGRIAGWTRLSLLKALADDSRYAIFVEMSRSPAALSTTELAERLELHPNTVRLHLERLRQVGLVEASTGSHGAVGRPQHQWVVTAQAPSLGLEPAGFRLLAHLLAEAAAGAAPESDELIGIGRRAGLDRAGALPARSEPLGGRRRPSPSACLQAVLDELTDLGFDPVLEPSTAPLDGAATAATVEGAAGGTGARVATETDATPAAHDHGAESARGPEVANVVFTRCPFRELAVAYPDLVCAFHRGITEGIAVGAAARNPGTSVSLLAFSTLVDADPCRAELAFLTGAEASS